MKRQTPFSLTLPQLVSSALKTERFDVQHKIASEMCNIMSDDTARGQSTCPMTREKANQ